MFKKLIALLNKAEHKNKSYVSEMDKFLMKYDKQNPQRSPSQKKEVEKHRDIFNRSGEERLG